MKQLTCKSCGLHLQKGVKFCPNCGIKAKKPFYKKWWVWLLVVIFLIAIGSGSNDNTEAVETEPADTSNVVSSVEPSVNPSAPIETITEESESFAEMSLTFELVAGESGKYGELFTINKDTEFEETYCIYHVPSGTYTVTNTGEYMSQLSIYSDEIIVNESGWEEPAETLYAKSLDVGDSDTVTITAGSFIEIQEPARFTFSVATESTSTLESTAPVIEQLVPEEDVPSEYRNALKKAESYAELLHMSKAGIYDQLVSDYGEGFPEEAAQYAIDNLEWDWNSNALASAESYSETLHMSKAGIYDQLISEYGEKFTAEEAQYAIDNLVADYKENALMTAKIYYEDMSMSKNAVYDQLISEYGEQFTPEEAQYAIDNLE